MTALAPIPVLRIYDNSGLLAIGAKVYTYQAGTSTPQATYTDSTQGTPNTNPVIGNSRGEVVMWLGTGLLYKVVVQDALGNLLYTADNVSGADYSSGTMRADLANTSDPTKGAGQVGFSSLLAYAVNTVGYFLQFLQIGAGAILRTLRAKAGERISIEDFGAKADAKTVSDGTMTAASAVLTSATAGFTAADVGKAICVIGAGASGAPLSTTISTFTSATSVTLALAASTTVSAKTIYWGTDDTAAVQAAVSSMGQYNMVKVAFPWFKKVMIAGKVFVPPLASIDVNGCSLFGNGSNTMFETGYWSAGAVVTNTGQANETQIVYGTKIRDGFISGVSRAFNLFNFCELSELRNLRFNDCDQAVYAKRCFYTNYSNLLCRAPLTAIGSQTLPCFHFDDAVNATIHYKVNAVGYKEGHRFSGVKDNPLILSCGGESCTTAFNVLNSTESMRIENFYCEASTTCFNFDSGGNHTNIYIDSSHMLTTTTAINGSTILSGEWGANNSVNGAAINLGTNQSNRMIVRIPNDTTSVANTQPTLPAGYTLGDTNRIDYVKTLYDAGTGLAVSKAQVHSGINPMFYGGGSGSPSAGTVPWCTVTVTATTVTIDTRITFTNFEFINYMLQVTDGSSINLAGRVVFGTVFPETGFATKTVAASSNAGFLRLTISGLTAATACVGLVRHQ